MYAVVEGAGERRKWEALGVGVPGIRSSYQSYQSYQMGPRWGPVLLRGIHHSSAGLERWMETNI